MKKITLSSTILGSLLLSACATQTGWTPQVDTYNDRNAYRLNQDMSECAQLADQSTGGVAKEAAIGAGVGGLVGAAGGAAIGAISGDPGKGAAIGAAAGGIGAGAHQGYQANERYKNAYKSCLRQRGHNVIN
jgi:outer membrane lipoprotein SlyB